MTRHQEEDFSDRSLLDLFRSEMDTYGAVLSTGLVDLENDPENTPVIRDLMRAAHSVKGGAKIVGLEAAVRIAHTLEDCFAAVQKGNTRLEPAHIDDLLRGADMLTQIAESAAEKGQPTVVPESVDHLVEKISAIVREPVPAAPAVSHEAVPEMPPEAPSPAPAISSGPVRPPLPAEAPEPFPADAVTGPDEKVMTSASGALPESPSDTSEEEIPAPDPMEAHPLSSEVSCGFEPAPKGGTSQDRTVRVTAGKIERLMGLAGEVVVSARWLPPFSESLFRLKRSHAELSNTLDQLQKVLEQDACSVRSQKLAFQARENVKTCTLRLAERISQMDMFTSVSATLSDRLYHEVIGVRMCPFADGTRSFPRLVRDLARELGKKIRLRIIGKFTEVDRDILEKLEAPLNHLLRNAVDHGIETPAERRAARKAETGIIRLEAVHRSGMLMIIVSDDGRGIDPETLRGIVREKQLTNPDIVDRLTESELMEFLFLPGFTTARNLTEISGRGVGLDVVHNIVHDVGGVVRAMSAPGHGMTFHLELPLTLSVVRTFLVEIAGEPYAFPLARIERCLRLEEEDIEIVEDRQYFRFNDDNIALVDIHEVLEIQTAIAGYKILNVVVICDRTHAYGLVVDKFLGECDLVVRPLDPRLGKVPDISAAAVMLDGSPVLIFDVEDLVHSISRLLAGRRRLNKIEPAEDDEEILPPKRILVVEDSFLVREKERKLLENRGYTVEVAVDGMDGWNLLRTAPYDLVVSDIDMPRMNGFELIRNIRQHPGFKNLPVIVVSYKVTEEDRLEGLEAGANYYLTKTDFNDNSLINAVVDLIGEP